MDLKQVIRAIPDFPKPGILFQDITPVMEDPAAYRFALRGLQSLLTQTAFNKLGAIESRGFVFGGPLALEMDKPLVLLRKAGKLPADTLSVTYSLEYGNATLEVHRGSFGPGDEVILVDDLLATGGTAAASAQLVTDSGAGVAGFLFLVELEFLNGRRALEELGPVFSLVTYS